jgi:type II secretory pathway pseudopilin PulG
MMNKRDRQKGMILLELLVALAITGMVLGGILALIFQEYRGTDIAKTSVTVAHEIRNAARWVSQDGMMAASTNLVEGATPASHLALTWTERRDFADIPHSCSYYLEGSRLCRDCDGIVTTVAQDISKIEFSQTDSLLTVSIGCTPRWWRASTVEKTYHICFRAADGG